MKVTLKVTYGLVYGNSGTSEDRDWKLYFEKNNFLNDWKFTKIAIKDPLKRFN